MKKTHMGCLVTERPLQSHKQRLSKGPGGYGQESCSQKNKPGFNWKSVKNRCACLKLPGWGCGRILLELGERNHDQNILYKITTVVVVIVVVVLLYSVSLCSPICPVLELTL